MPENRVHAILEQLYDEVFYLVDWLHQFRKEKKFSAVLLESDSQSYKKLLETTIIGVTCPTRPVPTDITFSQGSHQQEIVLRVVEKLYKRKELGRNVLTLGYGPLSDNPKAHVSSAASIECYYPNNNVSRLQYKSWKTLLSRIGDVVMSYLLENTAIFIFLPPNCYVQVAGVPIYELCSFKNNKRVKCHHNLGKNKLNRKRHQRYWQKFSKKGNKHKRQKLNNDSSGLVISKPKERISRSVICNTLNDTIPGFPHESSDDISLQVNSKHSITQTHVQRSDSFGSSSKRESVSSVSENSQISYHDTHNPCPADLYSSELGQVPKASIVDRKSNQILTSDMLKSENIISKGARGLKRKFDYEIEDGIMPKKKCLKLDVDVKVKFSLTKFENTELDSMATYSDIVPNQSVPTIWNKSMCTGENQHQERSEAHCNERNHKQTDYGQKVQMSVNEISYVGQSQYLGLPRRECKESRLVSNTESQSASELQSSEFSQYEAVPIGYLEQNSQAVAFVPLHTDTQTNHLLKEMGAESDLKKNTKHFYDKTSALEGTSTDSSDKRALPVGDSEVHTAERGICSPAKKKCRRRRKKPPKHQEIKDYKPYDFHKCFPRLNLLYTRNLREGFDKSFCLNQLNSSQLANVIFTESAVAIPACTTQQSVSAKNPSTNQNCSLVTTPTTNTATDSRTDVSNVNVYDKRELNVVLEKTEEQSDKNTVNNKGSRILENVLDPAGKIKRNTAIQDSSVMVITDGEAQIHNVSKTEQILSSNMLAAKIDGDETCKGVEDVSPQTICSMSEGLPSVFKPQTIPSSAVSGEFEMKCSAPETENTNHDVAYSEVLEENCCLSAPKCLASTPVPSSHQSKFCNSHVQHSNSLSDLSNRSCDSSKSQSGSGSLFSKSGSSSEPHITSSIPPLGSSRVGVDKPNSWESCGSNNYNISEYSSSSVQGKQQDSSSLADKSLNDGTALGHHHADTGSSKDSFVLVGTSCSLAVDRYTDRKPDEQIKNSSAVDSVKDDQLHILPTSSSAECVSDGEMLQNDITDKSPVCQKTSGQDHSSFFDSETQRIGCLVQLVSVG